MRTPFPLARPLAAFVLLVVSGSLGAQPARPSLPMRVSLKLDTTRIARFDVRAFDLGVVQNAASAGSPSSAQIQLVKQAGPYTGELIRLSASGQHLDSGSIEVVDSTGVPTLVIRLTDIAIVSDHLASSTAREALEQQRISQDEALAQLTSDYQEAQRDLTTAEELGKSRVTTRQDLARARAHAADLQQRIEFAKQRQALLARQLAAQSALEETLVLRFGSIDIVTPGESTTASWTFGDRAYPQDSTATKPRERGSGRRPRPNRN